MSPVDYLEPLTLLFTLHKRMSQLIVYINTTVEIYSTIIFFTGQVKQLSLILWFLHVTQFSYAESCGDWVSSIHGIMLLYEVIKLYKIPFRGMLKYAIQLLLFTLIYCISES